MRRLTLLALFVVLVLVPWAEAATLYVNNSGSPACSDATAKASNASGTPWCTIGRAAWGSTNRAAPVSGEAASAGDVVLVTPGTYSGTGHGDKYPYYSPVNSGSSGNLITFQSATSGTYVDLTFSSGSGGMIGAHNSDYIKWKDFRIDEATAVSASDTGPIVVWSCTGCVIDHNYVDGNGDPGYGDNHNGIRIEDANNVTVSNNTVVNVRTSIVNQRNGACIMTYAVRGSTIEHNDLSDCGTGIYLKGESTQTQYGYTVRYNLIHETSWGMYITNFTNAAGDMTNVYQNIVRDCTERGISISGDVSSLYNVSIDNNTIDGCVLNMGIRTATGGGLSFTDNLSTNPGGTSSSYEVFAGGDATSHTAWSSNYNLYYGQDRWTFNSTAYTTLANWRTAISDEANSSVQDPLYVNAASNDFHLQAGSPALTASSTGGPVGAYITGSETIGVETGAASTVGTVISGGVRFTGSVRIQ